MKQRQRHDDIVLKRGCDNVYLETDEFRATVVALKKTMPGARKILVVDDDDAVRDMMTEYLDSNGFDVSAANGIKSMRDAVTRGVFDLVLLDRTMPDGDGLDYVPEIRKGFGIPVILLTALSEANERVKGLDDGADDYISKPFDWRELLARINCVIRRATVHRPNVENVSGGNDQHACEQAPKMAPGRRYAAILCADVVEYVRLMRENEDETLRHWWKIKDTVIDPALLHYCGRIVKYTGDGFFAEFITTDEAVRSAFEMQKKILELNTSLPESRKMQFRMGLNWCSFFADQEDVYGDGINVAARLQKIADPGGICLPQETKDQLSSVTDIRITSAGERLLKHISAPINVYQIKCSG